MERFMEKYNVSRETFLKLKTYEASLHEWQNKFNLVSKASLENAWQRHFEDSVQLFKFIPTSARIMLDFGSGAGFPALVLAIMAQEKLPQLKVKLIESIKKKTLYLNTVKELCKLNIDVVNDRIENLPAQKVDVITSRAMCNLNDLLKYSLKFTTKQTLMIFPKGRSYQEELDEARRNWKFDCRIEKNEVSDDGVILLINHLSSIKGVK